MTLSGVVHFVVLLAPAALLLLACVDILVFFRFSNDRTSSPLYLERNDRGNTGSPAS